MIPQTKADLVLTALRKAAIASDATLTEPEPESIHDALSDLELMLAEWEGPINTIRTGYNFELPDQNGEVVPEALHGLANWMINAVVLNLAVRLLPDYKTQASADLVTKAAYAKQQLINAAPTRQRHSHHRRRTPIGSGNRWANTFGFRYYHGAPDDKGEGD